MSCEGGEAQRAKRGSVEGEAVYGLGGQAQRRKRGGAEAVARKRRGAEAVRHGGRQAGREHRAPGNCKFSSLCPCFPRVPRRTNSLFLSKAVTSTCSLP